MLTRRDAILRGGIVLAAAVCPTVATAVPLEIGVEPPREWPEVVPTPDEARQEASKETGALEAYEEEIEIANKLLASAPVNTRPVDVAGYFMGIGLGEQGGDVVDYVEEWPVRWNPVIIEFWFRGSKDRRKNDVANPWCAAFVNYCLLKARTGRGDGGSLTPPTLSAASKSFRTWGKETSEPKYGDLAVFADVGDDARGHVGFFVGGDTKRIWVLGGNQRMRGRNNTGQVCIASYMRNGKNQKLHSFRTDPSLHDR